MGLEGEDNMFISMYYEYDNRRITYKVERYDGSDLALTKSDVDSFITTYAIASDKFGYSYGFDTFLEHLGFYASIVNDESSEAIGYIVRKEPVELTTDKVYCKQCGRWVLSYSEETGSWHASSDYVRDSNICRCCIEDNEDKSK